MALIPRWAGAPASPHDQVVPDDLNVAPALLGLPLARPSRRLLAMGIDLALLALLTHLGNLWWLLALGLGLNERLRQQRQPAPAARRAVWLLVLLLVLLGVRSAWQAYQAGPPDDAEDSVRHTAGQAWEAARTEAAADLAEVDFEDSAEPAGVPAAAASAAAAGGSASAASVARASGPGRAASVAAAGAQARRLQRRIQALEADLAAAQAGGVVVWQHRIGRWVNEYGLGYGWATLYFTLLPGWLGGAATPGKRLLGLQVVELTGKPMTPMRWLKRYGGYAAGMATGGLGLAQLLWDSNRQALQDKTAHTVVVDMRRAASRPGGEGPMAEAPPAA